MNNGWTAMLANNNQTNSPMVDLYFGISRPCGNMNQQYMYRQNYSHPLLADDKSDCEYASSKGSPEHSLFYSSGY